MLRLLSCGAASALVTAAAFVLTGCDPISNASPAAGARKHVSEEAWLQYRSDLVDVAALVAQYVRHWEAAGEWPKPGTYNTKTLIYKGTESGTPNFPNRRRDFYRALFDGGRELDVIMYDDGRISVEVFRDQEPEAPAR